MEWPACRSWRSRVATLLTGNVSDADRWTRTSSECFAALIQTVVSSSSESSWVCLSLADGKMPENEDSCVWGLTEHHQRGTRHWPPRIYRHIKTDDLIKNYVSLFEYLTHILITVSSRTQVLINLNLPSVLIDFHLYNSNSQMSWRWNPVLSVFWLVLPPKASLQDPHGTSYNSSVIVANKGGHCMVGIRATGACAHAARSSSPRGRAQCSSTSIPKHQ